MDNLKITDVRALSGDSAFLIDDGKTSIMYDSGFAFTGYRVAENIKKILGERKLDYIFLTHSHYDHAAGSAYVKRYWPDAKVVAGEYATKIFAKPTAKAIMRDLDKKFAAKCGVYDYEDLFDELCVDIAVSDGDVIKTGDMEFVVLSLPGHTKCSVGYYCPQKKLLLGCETLGVFNGTDNVVPSYLVGYDMTLEAIRRVQGLDIDNILCPHFGLMDKSQTQLYLEKAMDSAVTTAQDIRTMLGQGKTMPEMIEFIKNKFY